jgi:uncharacterized protein (DUF1800 family)
MTFNRHRWISYSLVGSLLAGGVGGTAAASSERSQHVQWSAQQKAEYLLNRLAYGPAPGDIDRVIQMGPEAYIAEQLHPETLAQPAELEQRLARLDSLKASPSELFTSFGPPARKAAKDDDAAIKQVQQNQNDVADQAREARLLQAIYSPAQLQEVMVDFWFNHFNVFIDKGPEGKLWTGAYERDAIRPYALGRFRDLLGATAKHPAMLFYLDNWQSSVASVDKNGNPRGGINENYAREVMELHTLGVDGGYTQKDVTELARILSGWTFVPKDLEAGVDPAFEFIDKKHDAGSKLFLGKTFAAGGGIDEGERALDMLAQSPATAHHLAYQLAQYFVDDQPPAHLVDRLAQRYLKTDGDIREVLATLFKSPEFLDPANAGKKFKTPFEYVVSSLRASGLPMVTNVRPLLNALRQNGEPLYACLTPDGYKNTEDAWLNPDAMIYRLNFANALGNGALPLWQSPPGADAQASNASNAAMPARMLPAANVIAPAPIKPLPPDPFVMEAALGNNFSLNTTEALADARPQLRAGLILGSPEFMRR